MSSVERPNESLGICCLFGLAGLLLCIAIFMDPIGSSPDTGMIDLGSSGTKWLLGGLGAAFALGGVWSLLKNKSQAPESDE
jgi:predicted phage tail protein